MDLITRRSALVRLSVVPFAPLAARLRAQAQPAGRRRIFPGTSHTLLLEPDGALKGWPTGPTQNSSGELGQGHFDPMEKYRLFPIPGLGKVVAAGAGWDTSFAVLADGRVLSWGARGTGIRGITPLSYVEVRAEDGPGTPTPTPVAARVDAVDLSVGSKHVLALARDGTVWAWGDGSNGRLGIGPLPVIYFKTNAPGSMSFVPFPVQIPGLTDVMAVSAGFDHSLALLKDGSIRAWGGNKYGQVGDGTTVDRATPVLVPGIGKVIEIAANAFSVAVLADGRALTWGENLSRSLGRAWKDDGTPAPTPALVPGVINGRAVSVGNAHVLVLTQAGTIVSWGWDAFGQAGQGTANELGVPAGAVKGVTGVHSVTASGNSSYAFLNDGRIVCWGTGRSWISVRGGAADVRGRGNKTPILLNVDGLDNG